jgi:hypothetical protein
MGSVFLAEITKRFGLKPQFTPDGAISREYGVYGLYTGEKPQNTYWTGWGGSYDNPVSKSVEIRLSDWLFPVSSVADLLAVENSCYAGVDFLLVHTAVHTWLYAGEETTLAERRGFLSGPKNAGKPSDMALDGKYAEARFSAPDAVVKLADAISGVVFFGTFSVSLDNSDGAFDGSEAVELFNSPVNILKASVENPAYGDFQKIRTGMTESVRVDSKKITVTASDRFRSLDGQACALVGQGGFPVEKEDALGKHLPVVFGEVSMPLIEIAAGKYLAAERITDFAGLYDENGEPLPCTLDGPVIVYSGAGKPKYARFTGYADDGLGSVITRLVARDPSLQYVPSVWDIEETERYIASQPRVGLAVTGGDIKTAVKTALQRDTAYLIQKNDGRLSVRRWGEDYALHEIPGWLITKDPEKDFQDAEKNYCSSCVVLGKYNDYAKTYGESYVYTDMETQAVGKYAKNKRAEYGTRLSVSQDMRSLAARLGARFSEMKDTVRVSVGADTARFNLLDKVVMKVAVNGRKYSDNEAWVIKETDPAQDKLVLEEL